MNFQQLTAERRQNSTAILSWSGNTKDEEEALDCLSARAAVNLARRGPGQLAGLGRPYTFNPARGLAEKSEVLTKCANDFGIYIFFVSIFRRSTLSAA